MIGSMLLLCCLGIVDAHESGHGNERLARQTARHSPRIGRFAENVHEHGGFLVPVSVRQSNVAGLGVFLDAAVPEGTLVWSFNETVGLSFGGTLAECVSAVDRLQLDSGERHYVAKHGYGYSGLDGVVVWRLANDRADFMNHQPPSAKLTLLVDPVPHVDRSYAARHLVEGDELFENYQDYAPTPAFVEQCFSKKLPSVAERCTSVQRRLPRAGRWWEYCQRHQLHNASFGRLSAPFVGKQGVKQLVAAMNISRLTTPRTLAVVHEGESPRAIAAAVDVLMAHDRAVVKISHMSGGVLQAGRKGIKSLKCAKHHCNRLLAGISMTECGYSSKDKPRHCSAALVASMIKEGDYGQGKGEMWYRYATHELLVEEFVNSTTYTTAAPEYRFWTAHGLVVFVEVMCGKYEYTYVSADFRVLDIEFEVSLPVHMRNYRACARKIQRPHNWAHLLHAAQRLAEPLKLGLVRVDLITDGCNVIHFSEYTFAPDACRGDDSSLASQQLVSFALRSPSESWQLTSPVVECIIGARAERPELGVCSFQRSPHAVRRGAERGDGGMQHGGRRRAAAREERRRAAPQTRQQVRRQPAAAGGEERRRGRRGGRPLTAPLWL